MRSVSRIEQIEACLSIPSSVAPLPTILDQSKFALKYEGVKLLVLSQALPLIDENELNNAFEASPTSQYLRKLCFCMKRLLRDN